jgi:hypothetical protein
MMELGVQPHHVEAVVNHMSGHKGGIARVYNRATYAREKAGALQRWAAHLMSIVESTNDGAAAKVVALHRIPA